MDVERDDQQFIGKVKLGGTDATQFQDVICGTVSINMGSLATGTAGASASAAVAGMTASHKVVICPATAPGGHAFHAAAAGAGSITVSAVNASAGTNDPAAVNVAFFAWK